MTQRTADCGTPTDGPIWTCVGVYEDGMQAAIFSVHAPHVGGVLDTMAAAIQAERLEHAFLTIAVFKGTVEEAHEGRRPGPPARRPGPKGVAVLTPAPRPPPMPRNRLGACRDRLGE